jgi:hypothetical protein
MAFSMAFIKHLLVVVSPVTASTFDPNGVEQNMNAQQDPPADDTQPHFMP